jgi:hypothetical protein
MKTEATIIIAAVITSSLTACSFTTAEWDAANQACKTQWYAKIPAKWHQYTSEGTKHVNVPDGNITCRTSLSRETPECTQGTKSISIPYTELHTIDLNAGRRNGHIAQCTARQCTNRYGNPECKPNEAGVRETPASAGPNSAAPAQGRVNRLF